MRKSPPKPTVHTETLVTKNGGKEKSTGTAALPWSGEIIAG